MEKFKIELFEKEYKNAFPEFEELNVSECQNLIDSISELYNFEKDKISSNLINVLNYTKIDVNENFDLIFTLNSLGILHSEYIFIDWYDFKRIDRMKLLDFAKHFHDIWYPIADDINIFDSTLKWILFIRHDGILAYVKHGNGSN